MLVIRALSIVFALSGLGLLTLGATQFNSRQDFVQHAWTASGTVTRVVPQSVRARIGFSTVSLSRRLIYSGVGLACLGFWAVVSSA